MRFVELDDHLSVPEAAAVACVAFGEEDDRVSHARADGALTRSELGYVRGLRCGARRAAWLAGRVAAKAAIARLPASGLSAERLEVLPAVSGAPLVMQAGAAARVPVEVSIAHTRGLAAAVAFDRRRTGAMGVDVEIVDQPIDPALLELAFVEHEACVIREADTAQERRLRTLRFWTAKEAVLKAVGKGLSVPLTDVLLVSVSADRVRASYRREPGIAVPFDVRLVGDGDHVLALAIEAADPAR